MNSILSDIVDLGVFHVRSAREYMAFWEDAVARKKAGMSLHECAACLCEHVGLVHRYTGKDAPRNALCAFPSGARKALARHTFVWIVQSTLPALARRLTNPEALTAEQIEQAQDLLIRRDALEVALRTARTVAGELVATDNELLHGFARARCALGEVDDALRARPDIAAVASRVMVPILAQAKVQPDSRHFWWFYEAREWDAEDQRILSNPEQLARSVGLSATVFVQKTKAEPRTTALRARPSSIAQRAPFPRHAIIRVPPQPTAARKLALAAHTAMSPGRRLESHYYSVENTRGGFTISECENEKHLAFEADPATKNLLEGARLIAFHTSKSVARIKKGCAYFLKPDKLIFALQLKNGKYIAVTMVKRPRSSARKAR